MMYLASSGTLYEIFSQFQREIPDQKSILYRFQIYYGVQTFACDLVISQFQINKYKLSEKDLMDIFYQRMRDSIESNMKEYHSITINKNDIKKFLSA